MRKRLFLFLLLIVISLLAFFCYDMMKNPGALKDEEAKTTSTLTAVENISDSETNSITEELDVESSDISGNEIRGEMTDRYGEISGRLLDNRGRPLANYNVGLVRAGIVSLSSDGGLSRSKVFANAVTNDNGEFSLVRILPGKYAYDAFRVDLPYHNVLGRKTDRVSIGAGEKITNVLLTAIWADYLTCSGRVVDTQNRPMSNVEFSVKEVSPTAGFAYVGQTNNVGMFAIADIPEPFDMVSLTFNDDLYEVIDNTNRITVKTADNTVFLKYKTFASIPVSIQVYDLQHTDRLVRDAEIQIGEGGSWTKTRAGSLDTELVFANGEKALTIFARATDYRRTAFTAHREKVISDPLVPIYMMKTEALRPVKITLNYDESIPVQAKQGIRTNNIVTRYVGIEQQHDASGLTIQESDDPASIFVYTAEGLIAAFDLQLDNFNSGNPEASNQRIQISGQVSYGKSEEDPSVEIRLGGSNSLIVVVKEDLFYELNLSKLTLDNQVVATSRNTECVIEEMERHVDPSNGNALIDFLDNGVYELNVSYINERGDHETYSEQISISGNNDTYTLDWRDTVVGYRPLRLDTSSRSEK